ncbi:MAG: hypothetical protein D6812_17560 [Deltaproteobacteria bacterium]|nr:MAG: hypothetical protein D6812_17560 [Deltaproteobacteria bacterium]
MRRKVGVLIVILLVSGSMLPLLLRQAARTWEAHLLAQRIDAERIQILSIRLKVEAYIALYDAVPTRTQLTDAFFPDGFPERFGYLKVEENPEPETASPMSRAMGSFDALFLHTIVARNPVRDLALPIEDAGGDFPPRFQISAGKEQEATGVAFLIYGKDRIEDSYLVATRYLGPVFLKDLPDPIRKRLEALRIHAGEGR